MQWLDLLPHQPPMRLLEEVVSVGPGKEAVGGRLAKPEDFYFQGHFPQDPIVPAIILVELVAQVGGLAAGVPDPAKSHARCSCAWQRLVRSNFPLPRDLARASKHRPGSPAASAASTGLKEQLPLME